ncbi:MAG: hypothetical protein ACFCUH_00585 [Flavobacteriales bacterium]
MNNSQMTPEDNSKLNEIYENLKEYGIEALLDGNCTRLQAKQLQTRILENIERNEILEIQWRDFNPHSPNMSVGNLAVDRRALKAVNQFLNQQTSPRNIEAKPEKKPEGIKGFTEREAALYLAYTGRQATTEAEAERHLHLFKGRLDTPKKISGFFNEVRIGDRRKALADKLKRESNTKLKNYEKRIKKVMEYLNEDQKRTAQVDLDYIEDIIS